MAPESDFRTDRVALRIDALIPELQALLEDLRHEVDARNAANIPRQETETDDHPAP